MANTAGPDVSAAPQDDVMTDVDDRVVEFMNSLPVPVRSRVEELQKIQEEHDEVEKEFQRELAALEKKYDKLYEPFYAKRQSIVTGQQEAAAAPEPGADLKGVPDFWLTVLKNHSDIACRITDRDEEALKHLQDIRWSRLEGENDDSFKLEFVFSPNPFFSNEILTKTYHMEDDDGEPVLEKAVGTVIEWKKENLCAAVKSAGGANGEKVAEAKDESDDEECDSFFSFFTPSDIPEDKEKFGEMEMEVLREDLEEQYELGMTIREQIIPHAVSWFTGEAVEDDEDEDDEDDEDGDEEADAAEEEPPQQK